MSAGYINSAACISVQDTLNENFPQNLKPENSVQILKAIEPNYKEFIPPAASRRMSKTVKMSSVASKYALKEAGIEKPDGSIIHMPIPSYCVIIQPLLYMKALLK